MVKIVLASDNHGDYRALSDILMKEPDGDYYIHLGDSEMSEEEIEPFISVRGNNDYLSNYPKQRIFDLDGHRILAIHGTGLVYLNNVFSLVDYAKHMQCDVCFFGHSHIPFDLDVDGVRLINPGSCHYNRDRSKPCYMEVFFSNGEIKTKRIDI